jgi:hypothetical protein
MMESLAGGLITHAARDARSRDPRRAETKAPVATDEGTATIRTRSAIQPPLTGQRERAAWAGVCLVSEA